MAETPHRYARQAMFGGLGPEGHGGGVVSGELEQALRIGVRSRGGGVEIVAEPSRADLVLEEDVDRVVLSELAKDLGIGGDDGGMPEGGAPAGVGEVALHLPLAAQVK